MFDSAGVHPHDLRSLSDLARFPFTTKDDLRTAGPFGFMSVPREGLARLHASSGTTGSYTVVGYTKRDIATWAEVMARSIYAAGGRPGMAVHVAYGYGLFTGGLGAHYGAEELGCMVIPVSGAQTERQVQLIRDLGPSILMMTPSYALTVLDEYRRQGLDPAASSPRVGIFGAEPWSEGMRNELEQGFGIDALDIYGLSEIVGPGVAQECIETKDGPTIWEDHFYPEIIDPNSGEVLGPGEDGELVLTTLTREAMPLIRYRTRDLSSLLPGSARPMRRMSRVKARSDDMMIIRGVNVFPMQIEQIVLTCPTLAPHYRIELSRPRRMDVMRILVEPRGGASLDDAARDSAVLMQRIKSLIGIACEVDLQPPGAIERSAGKARRVDDLRPKLDAARQ